MTVGFSARFKCTPSATLATWALLATLAACGGEDPAPAEADGGDACAGEGDTYRVGLSKTSETGAFTVELTDANPAPPALGTNGWTIRIKDANGMAVAGAAVNVSLYMPKHRHAQTGTVGTDQGGGAYDVTDLNLVMPGLFEITIEITPHGGTTDSTKFQFCVARKGD